MIKTLAITSILFSIFLTVPQVDAICTTTQFGNMAFTNCSDGRSGSSTTFGGISQTFNGTTFSQWNNSVTGVHQDVGDLRMDLYSDGTTCIAQAMGPTTSFTNCNGESSPDAEQRSSIIGTK